MGGSTSNARSNGCGRDSQVFELLAVLDIKRVGIAIQEFVPKDTKNLLTQRRKVIEI